MKPYSIELELPLTITTKDFRTLETINLYNPTFIQEYYQHNTCPSCHALGYNDYNCIECGYIEGMEEFYA
jgi:hypothetical protein